MDGSVAGLEGVDLVVRDQPGHAGNPGGAVGRGDDGHPRRNGLLDRGRVGTRRTHRASVGQHVGEHVERFGICAFVEDRADLLDGCVGVVEHVDGAPENASPHLLGVRDTPGARAGSSAITVMVTVASISAPRSNATLNRPSSASASFNRCVNTVPATMSGTTTVWSPASQYNGPLTRSPTTM